MELISTLQSLYPSLPLEVAMMSVDIYMQYTSAFGVTSPIEVGQICASLGVATATQNSKLVSRRILHDAHLRSVWMHVYKFVQDNIKTNRIAKAANKNPTLMNLFVHEYILNNIPQCFDTCLSWNLDEIFAQLSLKPDSEIRKYAVGRTIADAFIR